MTVTEITQIGTLALATLTATLAIWTFKRNKKQELENQLFKIKLDAFSNIAFELDNFFICLNRSIVKLHEITNDSTSQEVVELKKYSNELDEQMYKCHSTVVKYSIYFSVNSLESLLKFTDNLLGDDKIQSRQQEVNSLLWVNNYYSVQVKLANDAIDSLREELQLERLHHSLYSRTEL